MTTAGAGEAIMAGTTLGYGTPDGAGALAGAGTTLGDGIDGAGQTMAGAGIPVGAGATRIMVGDGPDIMDGAVIMAAIGTVHIMVGIMVETMPICPEEGDMPLVFQALPYHLGQMLIQADIEVTVAAPTQRFPETII